MKAPRSKKAKKASKEVLFIDHDNADFYGETALNMLASERYLRVCLLHARDAIKRAQAGKVVSLSR